MPAVRLVAWPGGSARSGRRPVAVARPAHPPLALALADQAGSWFGDFLALWPAQVWSLKVPKNRLRSSLGAVLELSGARCGHPVCPISNYLKYPAAIPRRGVRLLWRAKRRLV